MARENYGSSRNAGQQALENSGLHLELGHVPESRPVREFSFMSPTEWRHSEEGRRYLRGSPVWMRGGPSLNN